MVCRVTVGLQRNPPPERQSGARIGLISDLELNLYEVDQAEIEQALMSIETALGSLILINKGAPCPRGALGEERVRARGSSRLVSGNCVSL